MTLIMTIKICYIAVRHFNEGHVGPVLVLV